MAIEEVYMRRIRALETMVTELHDVAHENTVRIQRLEERHYRYVKAAEEEAEGPDPKGVV